MKKTMRMLGALHYLSRMSFGTYLLKTICVVGGFITFLGCTLALFGSLIVWHVKNDRRLFAAMLPETLRKEMAKRQE
jgi:hypothetical protein